MLGCGSNFVEIILFLIFIYLQEESSLILDKVDRIRSCSGLEDYYWSERAIESNLVAALAARIIVNEFGWEAVGSQQKWKDWIDVQLETTMSLLKDKNYILKLVEFFIFKFFTNLFWSLKVLSTVVLLTKLVV
jgi:hypothetical protein